MPTHCFGTHYLLAYLRVQPLIGHYASVFLIGCAQEFAAFDWSDRVIEFATSDWSLFCMNL